jgi:hypothetical protein
MSLVPLYERADNLYPFTEQHYDAFSTCSSLRYRETCFSFSLSDDLRFLGKNLS